MITAVTAKQYLERYAGENNDFYERLSLVIERLLKASNNREAKGRLFVTVAPDADGRAFVTTPRGVNTVLGAVQHGNSLLCGGGGLPVRNEWYEYGQDGPGLIVNTDQLRGVIPIPGIFTTFLDWSVAVYLRFKFETQESADKLIIKGKLNGSKIYSLDAPDWIEGIALPYTGATVTTTQLFDEPPYQIVKPITMGRVSMYIVDGQGVETLVAIYDPREIAPAFRRWKLPVPCSVAPVVVEPVCPPMQPYYSKAEIDAMFGDSADLIVNSVGTDNLFPPTPFLQWLQRVIVQDGVAPYVHNLTLNRTNAKKDATFRIAFEIEASANPTINIFDNTIADQLLDTVSGDSSNAQYYIATFWFDGTNWRKLQSGFQT